MRVFAISLIFASSFTLLSSMASQKKVSQGDLLGCMGKSSHGALQAFLYQELYKIWLQEKKNNLWLFVRHHAFDGFHPVLLYFVLRTYYDYAYEFYETTADMLPEIHKLAEARNLTFDLNSRLEAFESLMLFRIKSRIDTDICCEFYFPGNSIWMHKEFGDKLRSRVDYLEKWNQKFYKTDDYITFKSTFELISSLINKSRSNFFQSSPEWISLCSKPSLVSFCSKTRWRFCIGPLSDTIDFNDVPEAMTTKVFALMDRINESRDSKLDDILLKIKTLADDSHISDLEKWHRFLAI